MTQRTQPIPAHVAGIIYKITCSTNGKSYVGQTLTHSWNHGKWRPYGTQRRLGSHISAARAGQKTPLHVAIREHGEDNFTIAELCRCEVLERDAKETAAIVSENTLEPIGYNRQVVGAIGTTGTIRQPIKIAKKTEERKRAYDTAFETNAATTNNNEEEKEPVVCAHIREAHGVAPKIIVFFETATAKNNRKMQRTTFSATHNRDDALRRAHNFARQYTDNIDFVASQDGLSRSEAQRKTILELGASVTRIRAMRSAGIVQLFFETATATDRKDMLSTSFRDKAHNNDPNEALAAARQWATTQFPNTPFEMHGQSIQAIQ